MLNLNEFSFFNTVSEIKFNSLEDFIKASNISSITDKCYDESPSSNVFMAENTELSILQEILESNNIDFSVIDL